MSKRILILNGHPAKSTLNETLANAYAQQARQSGHEVRLVHLAEMTFDPDFGQSHYKGGKPLEADLEKLMENLEWCEHFVMTTPMWWGGLPAKLKGLFDRALLPGRAFDTRVKDGQMPKPLLQGRSARVIITSDTPGWLMRFVYRNALIWQIRRQILGFIGIAPARINWFAGASTARPETVEKWTATLSAHAVKAM